MVLLSEFPQEVFPVMRNTFLLASLTLCFLHAGVWLVWTQEQPAQDQKESPQKQEVTQKVEVKVTDVSARLSPTFEFELPSGNVYEHFVEHFNHMDMTFGLNYNFLDNHIAGDVEFAYPIKRWTPAVNFFLDLDFENDFTPQLQGDTIVILPTDKYISRDRGVKTSLSYSLYKNVSLISSFIVTDVFKGSLTEDRVLDEGTDYNLQLGAVYHTLRAKNLERMLSFEGLYLSTMFDTAFRDSLSNLTILINSNNLLFKFGTKKGWQLEEKLNLNYPVYIWNREISSFYSLGGFDSIRGYEQRSINAFRFLLVSSTIEKDIFKDSELKFRLWKLQVRAHQFALFFLFDQLFSQDTMSLHSPISLDTSVGSGLSFVLSGKTRGHFKVELYAAQPFEQNRWPILYFKTSLYSFEKKM
jgi:hypothetical protein